VGLIPRTSWVVEELVKAEQECYTLLCQIEEYFLPTNTHTEFL
jgi:hypothetical protein